MDKPKNDKMGLFERVVLYIVVAIAAMALAVSLIMPNNDDGQLEQIQEGAAVRMQVEATYQSIVMTREADVMLNTTSEK